MGVDLVVNQSVLLDLPDSNKKLDTGLHFDNLDSFISYIYYLTSKKSQHGNYKEKLGENYLNNEFCDAVQNSFVGEFDYDSKELLDCHIGNCVLKIDKYIRCAIPTSELEFILESRGIHNYEAFMDPSFNWKHSICLKNDIISEIVSPNIKGDHYNPYIRFKSCVSSASRSCSMLKDLVGLESKDLSMNFVHDNIFLDITLTFPFSVDKYLLNPSVRNDFIKRMNNCRKKFFHSLDKLWYLPRDNLFGMSSSLHVWSSEFPLIPHAHFHNVIPFFSYGHKSFINHFDIHDFCCMYPELIEDCIIEVPNGFKKFVKTKKFGANPNSPKSKHTVEVPRIDRFVVDRKKYNDFRLKLSNFLKPLKHFDPIDWSNSDSPVNIDKMKNLWSDIVYTEFFDIMDHFELLDIHVSWVPWYRKSKLRSILQYKIRPPVLDLDLMFRKIPNVVTGYNIEGLDIDRVLDYIDKQLVISIRCSDTDKINRYESLLNKLQYLKDNFPNEWFYDWLQFLSVWVTDTRIYGFWKDLKHYLLDSDYKILVKEEVCPICNHVICDTGIKTRYCDIDFVLIQERSKYLVYNVKDPPPDSFGGC